MYPPFSHHVKAGGRGVQVNAPTDDPNLRCQIGTSSSSIHTVKAQSRNPKEIFPDSVSQHVSVPLFPHRAARWKSTNTLCPRTRRIFPSMISETKTLFAIVAPKIYAASFFTRKISCSTSVSQEAISKILFIVILSKAKYLVFRFEIKNEIPRCSAPRNDNDLGFLR
jgi:hypothetical protein